MVRTLTPVSARQPRRRHADRGIGPPTAVGEVGGWSSDEVMR